MGVLQFGTHQSLCGSLDELYEHCPAATHSCVLEFVNPQLWPLYNKHCHDLLHTFKRGGGGILQWSSSFTVLKVKQIVYWYWCFSFLQGRSSKEKSQCVKTRRTLAHSWSPSTSETGSWRTACSNVGITCCNIHQISHFFYWPFMYLQPVGAGQN